MQVAKHPAELVDALLAPDTVLSDLARNELDHFPPGSVEARSGNPRRAGKPDGLQVTEERVNRRSPGCGGPQRHVSGAMDLLSLGERVTESFVLVSEYGSYTNLERFRPLVI